MKGRVVLSLRAETTIEILVKELTSGHVVLRIDGEEKVLSEGDKLIHTGTTTRDWNA